MSDRVRPPRLTEGAPFHVTVEDRQLGPVPLTGELHRSDPTAPLLVLVHGLGGSIESGYIRRTAMDALGRGFAVLRLNLRGADRSGVDIYHAGLTDDLRSALASDVLASHARRVVIGFSLGGHMSLRFAAESPGALEAVVAVCSPLDLDLGASHIDSRSRAVYCRHLLRGLCEIYENSAPAIESIVGTTVAEARRIRSIRQWDEKIVARRFGFAGASDYYAKATVLPLLSQLERPALMVRGKSDPMVSEATAALSAVSNAEIWRVEGGHIGFPPGSSIGARVLDWVSATLEK